jgi:hypothetical protein
MGRSHVHFDVNLRDLLLLLDFQIGNARDVFDRRCHVFGFGPKRIKITAINAHRDRVRRAGENFADTLF